MICTLSPVIFHLVGTEVELSREIGYHSILQDAIKSVKGKV